MKTISWLHKNASSLIGKTVAISGATGGIGQELCNYLTMLGASIILLDRNQNKSKQLEASLIQKYPTAQIKRI